MPVKGEDFKSSIEIENNGKLRLEVASGIWSLLVWKGPEEGTRGKRGKQENEQKIQGKECIKSLASDFNFALIVCLKESSFSGENTVKM